MNNLSFLSAVELAGLVRSREVSSVQLVNHFLERIDLHNKKLNAIVTLDADGAIEQARIADARMARGEELGPLHGVPMTVKDTYEVAGMRTTSGLTELSDYIPTRDADAVTRLRDAGAIIMGKTNMPANGGDWQSFNDVFGCTNNPWDLSRTPGGSSGGSAAALASGMVGFEIGSDVAGSLRIPAHYCGIYSLKTTFGIVSSRGHIPGPPGSLSDIELVVFGPMGRSASDLDLGLDVLAGPDPARAVAWKLDLPPSRVTDPRDLRVAVWLDDPYCPVESDVLDVLRASVDVLSNAGASVTTVPPPVSLEESHGIYASLLLAEGGEFMPQDAYDAMLQMIAASPDEELFELRAMTVRLREWREVNEERQRVRLRWAQFFEDYDVLLCPAAPTAAIHHDHAPVIEERTITVRGEVRPYIDYMIWSGLVTMPLLPAAMAPVGRTPGGLPVGIQIVAPYLQDRTAVAVARVFEEIVGGFVPPPGY